MAELAEDSYCLRVGVRFPRWLWFLIGLRWMEMWVAWHGVPLVPTGAQLVDGGAECAYDVVLRSGEPIRITNSTTPWCGLS